MSIEQDTKHKMEGALEHYKQQLRNLRTGRPNPGILDSVTVEVYGSEMKIKELANVSVSEPRQLVITPFDPQTSAAIAKSIEKTPNLNLKPVIESGVIRISIPALNEDMRKQLVKQAKEWGEATKVTIREVRRKSNETAKKAKADGDIPEDVMKKIEKKVQELTDQYCKEVDTALSTRKEIMAV